MKHPFPLFQSHLDLAHSYWKELLSEESTVIDATCGNGHDTLALAAMPCKKVVAIDIQEEAIESAKERLDPSFKDKVSFYKQCHSTFPDEAAPNSVQLIVYNLGYLPGGDKSQTTMAETTLLSIQNASLLLCRGGAISITCYPGHEEGALEEEKIIELVSQWSPKEWSCCHHRWLNRNRSPSLLLIQKNL